MKKLKLLRGGYTIIDDIDYARVREANWYMTSHGYVRSDKNKTSIYLHRIIMNARKGQHVDHINHDRLDNRRANLRTCSITNNNKNTVKRKDNKSGYKGVSKHSPSGLYRPTLKYRGRQVSCGYYKDPRHAAIVYDLWAIELYGEYANTNFNVVCHTKKPH